MTKKKVNYPFVGPCTLIARNSGNCVLEQIEFANASEAAVYLREQEWRSRTVQYDPWLGWGPYKAPHYELVTARGGTASVEELRAWCANVTNWYGRWSYIPPYVFRAEPIYRTGRRRCSWAARHRSPKTQGERRQNALTVFEEGEVAPRPCRKGDSLPTRWDDVFRSTEHNWKSQHKGRKSWDRR